MITSLLPGSVPRRLRARLEDHLRLFPAVALLGSRQVGKTTLARAIAEDVGGRPSGKTGLYLDLENPNDRENWRTRAAIWTRGPAAW